MKYEMGEFFERVKVEHGDDTYISLHLSYIEPHFPNGRYTLTIDNEADEDSLRFYTGNTLKELIEQYEKGQADE